MGQNNLNENDELFPNLSFYNRAVSYPYFAPNYSFSFYKGQFVKGICFDLDKRTPILSVGSNRSPYQLKRKFSMFQDICVTPATLYDSDIVYAASVSAYGSMPATQWPCEGAKVDLNVLWLNESQLDIMHLSEALGVAYNFVKLKLGTVKIKEFEWQKEIYGYVSIPGAFSFNENKPKRLSALKAQNTNLKGIYAVNFAGGQVDITNGKFVFSASEAYLVENGKIKQPLKGATLIGNGPDAMSKISLVGNDLALDDGIGTCGKDGQGVPVGVGQPTLLMGGITIGGTDTN